MIHIHIPYRIVYEVNGAADVDVNEVDPHDLL